MRIAYAHSHIEEMKFIAIMWLATDNKWFWVALINREPMLQRAYVDDKSTWWQQKKRIDLLVRYAHE